MPHIHIALVGGQPTPVFQVIEHVTPDQMVLLCSEQTLSVANEIRIQFKDSIECDIYQMPIDDLGYIQQFAISIAEAIPANYEVSLNVTSGVKPWALIFSDVFRDRLPHTNIYYVSQNGDFFNLSQNINAGRVQFDSDVQFQLLGHRLDDYTPLSEYDEADDTVCKNLIKLYLLKGKKLTLFMIEFGKYLSTQECESSENLSFSYKEDSIQWLSEKNTVILNLNKKEYVFSSCHVWDLVNHTGWFEYYVATMLADIYGRDNVRMNCKFKGADMRDLNEVDVIVNTGAKLLFVECKTQIKDSNDVNKFASVVRNYGALGSKALFVTCWEMYENGKEKCKDSGIATFTASLKKAYEVSKMDLINLLEGLINTSNSR